MAAGIIPAYDMFAEQYGVTVPDASYLTSFQVCDALQERHMMSKCANWDVCSNRFYF